ncbi:uncharacterized protein Eint_092040 [Encephalitozoon intestinalis ATCC 50506]|uniref:Uncharacterized protein n=1 Tax=Encephalitozoon intestinalis (strain ATCC 50506) TaxID=876142 RepID=E0S995_ENCIT|nr:uncharacterized protein Eint_092040 [Encephalitozoon intestinalis ATCC 50506]ADM12330.1 hypothetical protein Eint_092040 [Encephalitozoon intestinalis ATCC 50506]UTX46142.1 hypothetical protein GPK93_09g17320 [Encephalitozoon intestinalis]
MIDKIRSFLPSPRSLEPLEPLKKRVKRKERPSKCILSRSIYEETDLSRLTPRQRLLHQKYQENKNNVSSFFLLSNNIPIERHIDIKPKKLNEEAPSKSTDKSIELDCEANWKVRDGNSLQEEKNFLILTSDLYNSSYKDIEEEQSSSESNDEVIEAAEIESPFRSRIPENASDKDHHICKDCFKDAVEIYYILERISDVHKCRLKNFILLHKYKIRQNFKKKLCFSTIRREETAFIKTLEKVECCMEKPRF